MATPIVFVHGDLQNQTIFTNLKNFFQSKNHKCLALDLPGHGTEKEIKPIPRFLKEKITFQKPIIVAHSAGAAMALKYFEETRNASALILISPLLINPTKLVKFPRATIIFYKTLSKLKFKKQTQIDYSKIQKSKLRVIGLETTHPKGLENNINFYTSSDPNLDIKIPTLIIAPTKDKAISLEIYKKMSNKIKNSKLETINSGHNPLITNPKEIEKIIEKNYLFFTK